MSVHLRNSDRSAERMSSNHGAAPRREMSITQALEWAFRIEHARVEFDDLSDAAGSIRQGVDGIWLMMQRGVLGCKIDGGGHSDPAWDAEVIASAVASLPAGFGGRSMASTIAGLARAGLAPDWMQNARPTAHPVEVRLNQHGWTARTENASHLGGQGWPPSRRMSRKGAVVQTPVLYCPIRWTNTAAQVAAARRRYLDWWGALWWIGAELRGLAILETIALTDDMPVMTPWKNT